MSEYPGHTKMCSSVSGYPQQLHSSSLLSIHAIPGDKITNYRHNLNKCNINKCAGHTPFHSKYSEQTIVKET